ncbi:hypothetical protein KY284_012267 [Solanum tuberosum]|nr:hypothetical protein KY284_012267 [Solanum tuberosum]
MVEAIKNNGDRVVATSVRDDILNTTVTLNCTLATVSQTLVLDAKDGVTSDSVVPVINLESDLVSNPKLPTAGVLYGKDPSLATIEDYGQDTKVQQCEENLDQIFEYGGTCDHDFTLKDNDKGGLTEVPSETFSRVSRKIVCSNTFDALRINSDQELHALFTPILQVSNP